MEPDHWDELFDELYLKTYPWRFAETESEAEALGAARLAGIEPPAQILDAPTGYGRLAIPLARAGFRVTGLDRSPALLDEAARTAGDEQWPRWVRGDFRELPFEDESFDAVLNIFSSIGYRGEEGDRAMLAEFHRVLLPGGSLVLETTHRDRLMAIFQPRTWDPLPGGGIVAEARTFDAAAGEIETELTLVTGDDRRSVTYRLRVYTATELARLLAEAGFGELEWYGSYERGELSRDTRLVVRARK